MQCTISLQYKSVVTNADGLVRVTGQYTLVDKNGPSLETIKYLWHQDNKIAVLQKQNNKQPKKMYSKQTN